MNKMHGCLNLKIAVDGFSVPETPGCACFYCPRWMSGSHDAFCTVLLACFHMPQRWRLLQISLL